MLMASMAALTFYALPIPITSAQKARWRQLVVGRLSTSLTAKCMNGVGPRFSDSGISAVNRVGVVCTISRRPFQPISSHISAGFSAYAVITGFWVGPDSEDGYGFVQAFLFQT